MSTDSAVAVTDVVAGLATEDRSKRTELAGWITAQLSLAERGDDQALRIVKQLYQEIPSLRPAANLLQTNAELDLIKSLTDGGQQKHSRWVIEEQLAQMKSELAGENANALERLLIDRVALCWLDTQYCDALKAARLSGGHSEAQSDYVCRRAEQSQRQFLKASRALAMVRRLRLPAVQINVADRQINVAS